MSGALIAILVVAGVVIAAIVLLMNRLTSLAAYKVLVAMAGGTGSCTVTQLADATHTRGFLVVQALLFLQKQGLVESRQKPSRIRGAGAAAMDRATYRITIKGRRQVRQKAADPRHTS